MAKDKVVEMGLDTFGDLTEAVDGEMSRDSATTVQRAFGAWTTC